MATTLSDINYDGFTELEDDNKVTVRSTHRAVCNECGWEGEEVEEFDWKFSQQEAVEHWQENHLENEDEEAGS